MAGAIDRLRRVFGNPKKPSAIWQEPFDHNSSHYKRLCNLVGKLPTGVDLVDYSDDIHYQESLQPDLFKFLFPLCLESWRQYLVEDKSEYGAFVEHFELALSRRSYCPELLSEAEHEAVIDFFVGCILERMSRESSLSHSGMGASPYKWVEALDFFCRAFPELERIWVQWWEFKTMPLAICGLQYLSCFLYDDDNNPIFEKWTPRGGGGPPIQWRHQFAICEDWKAPNTRYLKDTLTEEFAKAKLQHAISMVGEYPVAMQMLREFEVRRDSFRNHLKVISEKLRIGPVFMKPD
jgi:hypothetical protein